MIVEIAIPYARIPVVIGEKGKTKRELERLGSTAISIEGNVVRIEGEALSVYAMENVIKAIGRGFPPEKALNLLDEEFELRIIDMPFQRNHRTRIRARVIGREGSVRKRIEEMTNTSIAVYGKTVSIIGRMEDVELAANAVEMIIRGSKHSNVFAYLSRRKERWLF